MAPFASAFREWGKKLESGSESTAGLDPTLGAVAVATQRPQMISASDEARETLLPITRRH